MKRKFGRKITALLLVFSTVLMLCVGVLADNIADDTALVSEVSYVFDYIDTSDTNAIEAAKQRMYGLTYGDSSSDINKADISELENDILTNQELSDLLKYTLAVYFSIDEKDFIANIATARDNIDDTLMKLFGTKDNWFDLFIRTKKDSQISVDPKGKFVWALGNEIGGGELYTTMDSLQVTRLNILLEDSKYVSYKTKFDELGWTAEDFVGTCRAIVNKADSKNEAEFNLLKAAARSSAAIIIDDKTQELKNAGMNLDSNYLLLDPGEHNLSAFIILEDNEYLQENNVTNVVGFYSSNTAIAEIKSVNKEKRYAVLNVKQGVKGYADIIIKRDPAGDYSPASANSNWNTESGNKNWLSKFRVIVPNVIGEVTDVKFENGILSWKAAENAQYYVVELYKGDEKIKTIPYETELTHNFVEETATVGTYTAKIIPYGETIGDFKEEGEAATSQPFVVEEALNPPTKPVWGADNYVVSWESVSGADSYIVYIYRNGTLIKKQEGVAGTSYNAEESFVETGDYKATVAVVKGSKQSSESEPTDIKHYDKPIPTYSLSGTVFLQTAQEELGKIPQVHAGDDENYVGDEVVIRVNSSTSETAVYHADKNGNYTITGLKIGETYTIVFERDCYLAKMISVKSSADITGRDVLLYYGDFNKTNLPERYGDRAINAADISYFAAYIFQGKDSDRVKARPTVLISGDKVNLTEFYAFLGNIGRTTTSTTE